MRTGKLKQALRILSAEGCRGPLPITPETRQVLIEKHPKAERASECTKLNGPICSIEPSVFDKINGMLIWKKAVNKTGSAGPSGMKAKYLKTLLSKKLFGEAATDLQKAIASLARILATEKCSGIDALLARCLTPLDKNPGVRPIGIGEVIMRVIGSCIMEVMRDEVKCAAGNLQVCVGHKAGGEAVIHAMREIYTENDADAVLLVDATNAFNAINREAMLHNISIKCPSFSQYVNNTYGNASKLYITGGNRQGDEDIILYSLKRKQHRVIRLPWPCMALACRFYNQG